jgi:hypothetical protein
MPVPPSLLTTILILGCGGVNQVSKPPSRCIQWLLLRSAAYICEHDPEKWEPVFEIMLKEKWKG